MKIQYVRVGIGLAAVVLMSVVSGQSNKLSVDDYPTLMKANLKAFDAADAAIAAGAFDDARVNVAIVRKNFMALRSFWSERNRADAVHIVGDGLNRFSQIEELLGHKQVPVELVKTAMREFRSDVCTACHSTYREGTAGTGFRFKNGVL